jgi:hypothetical protein
METITLKKLQFVVDRINEVTNSPREYRGANGVIAIGHYCLDGAYGGYALHRVCNTSGGITDISKVGHVSKRTLYDLMHAFLAGYEAAKGVTQ